MWFRQTLTNSESSCIADGRLGTLLCNVIQGFERWMNVRVQDQVRKCSGYSRRARIFRTQWYIVIEYINDCEDTSLIEIVVHA